MSDVHPVREAQGAPFVLTSSAAGEQGERQDRTQDEDASEDAAADGVGHWLIQG